MSRIVDEHRAISHHLDHAEVGYTTHYHNYAEVGVTDGVKLTLSLDELLL